MSFYIHHNKKKKFSSRNFFLFCLLIGAVMTFFAISTLSRVLDKKFELDNETETREKEIAELENSNDELKRLIEYLKTADYARADARKKLNVKMPNEEVIVITEPSAQTVVHQSNEERDSFSLATNSISNPVRWWNYFFE